MPGYNEDELSEGQTGKKQQSPHLTSLDIQLEVVEVQLVDIVLPSDVVTKQKNVNGHCWPSMHEYERQYDSDIARVSPLSQW